MNEELAHQCSLAVRYHETGALLLCDIDHFKEVNDSRRSTTRSGTRPATR